MPSLRLLAASLFVVTLLAPALAAHGGGYTPPPPPPPPAHPGAHYGGPGDTAAGPGAPHAPAPAPPAAPSTGGPSGPATPRPAGPAAPAGGGGASGGPAGPAAPAPGNPAPGPLPAAAARTGGGVPIDVDYGTWDYWWEFNKNAFLRLRDGARVAQTGSDDFYLGSTRRVAAKDSLRPSAESLVGTVLPALKRALDSTGNRDIATACLVAMAKVGCDHPDFRLLDVFAPRLRDADQEVRETAALAIGIAGLADAPSLALLEGLVLGDRVGRAARGGDVEIRTRAFAAYGLGLTARRATEVATKARAFAALRVLVDDRRVSDRDLQVAAITAIGLLEPNPRDYAGARLCDEALAVLEACYRLDLGAGGQLVQAHCPTAIARLVGRDHPRSGYFKRLFTADLTRGNGSRRGADAIAQSCALALGQMALPCDDPDGIDAECSRALLEAAREHVDAPTRNFALVALGQIGGAENRAALLREFDRGSKVMRRPWCALALGLQVFTARERGLLDGPDALVASTLHDALLQAKEPGLAAALGIGLGLCRAQDAAAALRERMVGSLARDKLAGYLALGLALMDDAASVPTIEAVVQQASRRPDLLVQSAVALGRLGDLRVAEQLVTRMTTGEPNLTTLAALSSATGCIGDRRSIAPLVQMLLDPSVGSLPRAFAAAALGGIADRQPLPWNTPIGANVNYRANVETLTNQTTGVLDIL